MGVYALVHICVERAEPLPVETRVAIVELAIEQGLINEACTVSVRKPRPISGAIAAIKALFGVRKTYWEAVEKGAPGAWVAERVRTAAPDFSVSSPSPMWKGESLTGPFVYTCYERPRVIEVGSAYRRPDERSFDA